MLNNSLVSGEGTEKAQDSIEIGMIACVVLIRGEGLDVLRITQT
jgi:hypothetical protein